MFPINSSLGKNLCGANKRRVITVLNTLLYWRDLVLSCCDRLSSDVRVYTPTKRPNVQRGSGIVATATAAEWRDVAPPRCESAFGIRKWLLRLQNELLTQHVTR